MGEWEAYKHRRKRAIGWDDWLIVHIVFFFLFLFFSSAYFCAGRLGHGSGSGHSWHTSRHTTDDPSHAADTLCLTTRRVVDAREEKCV